MRVFEKISFEQFKKDIKDDKKLYDDFLCPKRATKYSAGYDFYALEDYIIKPGEVKKIPTGIKASMLDDEVLMIFVRSSMGFKYNVRLTNQVGIIDKDYYNNPNNEGHIWLSLQNEANEEYKISKNTGIGQGIFTKFLLTDNDDSNDIRISGIGSTDRR